MFVNIPGRVVEDDVFVVWIFGEIIGVEEVIVGDFEFGGNFFGFKFGGFVEQCFGDDFCLVIEWSYEIKELFMVFNVFINCKDVWIRSDYCIVDGDVVFNFECGVGCQMCFWVDVNGYYYQIGWDNSFVLQYDCFDFVFIQDCGG